MTRSAQWKIARMVLAFTASVIAVSPAAFANHGRSGRHHGRQHGDQEHHVPVILAFGTMYGVDGGFVGDANKIRDTIGDEVAWKLTSARGFLATDGHLRIRVRGLIFGDGTPNDESTFRARVSCLTEDPSGSTPTANVTTDGFPADVEGDSDIDAQVTLPDPCVAPIIFILAGSEDKWFAVTGFEAPSSSALGRDAGGRRRHGGD